jgi:hypothetical protein
MKTLIFINPETKSMKVNFGFDAKRLIVDFIADKEDDLGVDFKEVEFGYQIQAEGEDVVEESWPMPKTRYGKFKPKFIITSADVQLKTDCNYRVLFWCEIGKHRISETRTFNSGRPVKIYDSMVWNKETEEWDMLKPYPENSKVPMFWSEDKLEWQEYKFEEEESNEG